MKFERNNYHTKASIAARDGRTQACLRAGRLRTTTRVNERQAVHPRIPTSRQVIGLGLHYVRRLAQRPRGTQVNALLWTIRPISRSKVASQHRIRACLIYASHLSADQTRYYVLVMYVTAGHHLYQFSLGQHHGHHQVVLSASSYGGVVRLLRTTHLGSQSNDVGNLVQTDGRGAAQNVLVRSIGDAGLVIVRLHAGRLLGPIKASHRRSMELVSGRMIFVLSGGAGVLQLLLCNVHCHTYLHLSSVTTLWSVTHRPSTLPIRPCLALICGVLYTTLKGLGLFNGRILRNGPHLYLHCHCRHVVQLQFLYHRLMPLCAGSGVSRGFFTIKVPHSQRCSTMTTSSVSTRALVTPVPTQEPTSGSLLQSPVV